MPTLKYTFQKSTFCQRPDPRIPGMVEFNGYVQVGDLPTNVPAGCNPRNQNIDKGIYRQVVNSLIYDEDQIFHIKNRGITVLAEVAEANENGAHVTVEVEVPKRLGNVDGNHTQQIINKYGERNPRQYVHVSIRSMVPNGYISEIAQALNTNMPVTSASMADHRGLFNSVRETLKDEEYANWIGYRQNAQNTSAISKDLIAMMWVCHPVVPEAKKWVPNWVVTRSTSVFDAFYNPSVEKDEYREHLTRMNPVLADIIAFFCHINESTWTAEKVKHVRGGGTAKAVKQKEVTRNDLCVVECGIPFRDPSLKLKRQKHHQLKECYRFLILSGLRSLLKEGSDNQIEWKEPLPVIQELLDEALPKIYEAIVNEFRQNRRDHNKTSRSSALWRVPQAEIERAYSNWREERMRAELAELRSQAKQANPANPAM